MSNHKSMPFYFELGSFTSYTQAWLQSSLAISRFISCGFAVSRVFKTRVFYIVYTLHAVQYCILISSSSFISTVFRSISSVYKRAGKVSTSVGRVYIEHYYFVNFHLLWGSLEPPAIGEGPLDCHTCRIKKYFKQSICQQMEKTWNSVGTFPGVVSLPKVLLKLFGNSFRRFQNDV